MINIIVGWTFAERESRILKIEKQSGFKYIIQELDKFKQDLEYGGILTNLEQLIFLFNNLEMVGYKGQGNIIFCDDAEDYKKLCNVFGKSDKNINSLHKAWLQAMYDLCEDIDELYRYGNRDDSKIIIYLKEVLSFLAFTNIEEDSELFRQHMDIF